MTRQACTNLGCGDEAVAQVQVGATWMPKCFTHEREHADRYGPDATRPLDWKPNTSERTASES